MFDPLLGARIGPAWRAALDLLSDGDWWPRSIVTKTMLDASDILPKTCSNLIRVAVKTQVLEQQGKYPNQTVRANTVSRGTPWDTSGHLDGVSPGTPPPLGGARDTSSGVPDWDGDRGTETAPDPRAALHGAPTEEETT